MKSLTWMALGAGLLGAATPALACDALRIAEIRIDQPGADVDEYFELIGPADLSLNGITYLVIGDEDGAIPPMQNGTIEAVIDLSGLALNGDGLLLVGEKTLSLGVPDLIADLNFEQNDNVTHLLVTGFVGALGDDLDTDDDGVLDVEPWGGVLCSVALVNNPEPDGVTSDYFYDFTGNVVGPDSFFTPSHVWRCTDTDEWQIGASNPGTDDTAGALNPTCAGGVDVTINEVRIEQSGDELDEFIELAAAPGTSLTGLTYVVVGDAEDDTNSGVVEEAVSLDGFVIGETGFLLIAEDDNTFGVQAELITPLNFEGSDNVSHFLVQGFFGAIGDDLDTNDDGVFDAIPWSGVVDSIAFVETGNPPAGDGNEWLYGDVTVGPDGPFVPAHAYLCTPDGTWTVGSFDPVGGNDSPAAENPECIQCGNVGSGGCFEANGIPGCEDVACCEAVCNVDPACCDTGWDESCVESANLACLAGGDPPALTLSEVRIDNPGTDVDEFFELVGEPGTSLNGVSYIVIGDGGGGSGTVEAVVNLAGASIPASGRLVVAEETFTLGTADVTADLNFENSDNVTHLVVFNFFGGDNQDLDDNDDGVLDVEPWQSVIDSVALVETLDVPANGEFFYAEAVGPDGDFVPAHAYRCEPDGTWSIGVFDPVNGVDSPGEANAACVETPVCGDPAAGSCFFTSTTPGCDNAACCEAVCSFDMDCCETAWDEQCVALANTKCVTGGEAPDVLISEIRTDQISTDLDEYFELAGEAGTSLDGVSYVVIGDGAGADGTVEAVIGLSGLSIPATGLFVAAEETFTLGTADLTADLNFENSDNVSHFLVFNFTGGVGDDLDTDDDGVLDVEPWQSVIDSIALVENLDTPPTGTEWYYGETVGPDGTFVPGHVYRCTEAGGALGAWTIGAFDPVGDTDTPTAANPACEGGCPICPDFNTDGMVDGADLGLLLAAWGTSTECIDVNGDGNVDGADLGLLLAAWGVCTG